MCIRDRDEIVEREQRELNRLYDSFTAKYGLLNSRANTTAFSPDSSFPILCSLEVLDESGNLERKADVYKRQVPLWEVQPGQEADIIESLENSFGELENKENLAAALLSTAKNIVEDNKMCIRDRCSYAGSRSGKTNG